LIIATTASYLGINTSRGTEGVGQASTRSMVLASMLPIGTNVLLVRLIYFFYPQ
jgi:ABC-type transporter Mla maintaining outer membrane lipid asymmetry permease subunit MlaE